MKTPLSPKNGIEVYAYVAAKSADGDKPEDLDAAAKAWVKEIDSAQTVIQDVAA